MVTLLDVSAVAGHHAMPAALLLELHFLNKFLKVFLCNWVSVWNVLMKI